MEIFYVSIRHLRSVPKSHVGGLRPARRAGNARRATQSTMPRPHQRKIDRFILVPASRTLTATRAPNFPEAGRRRADRQPWPPKWLTARRWPGGDNRVVKLAGRRLALENSWLGTAQVQPKALTMRQISGHVLLVAPSSSASAARSRSPASSATDCTPGALLS